MKQKILYLMILVAVTSCSSEINSEKNQDSIDTENSYRAAGFVTASNLRCRSRPDLKSEIIKEFKFASPVRIHQRSSKKIKISGITDYWYKISDVNCWLFGGFLVLDNKNLDTKILDLQSVTCNVSPCGGNSCGTSFKPVLAGKYFSTKIYCQDYCMGESEPCTGYVIGSFKKSSKGYEFGKANIIGVYDSQAKWIGRVKSGKCTDFDYAWNKAKLNRVLYQHSDDSGTYYSNKHHSKISRSEAKKICKGSKSESVEGVYYTERQINPSEFSRP